MFVNKYSEEIEHHSDILLNDTLQQLFINSGLKLRSYPYHKEKGIDFNFEIENREEKPVTLGMFFLQNKGTEEDIKPLKQTKNQGKISFKLDDIRQIHYFCAELDQPIIITLCDLKTKTIYWESIQLDSAYYLEEVGHISAALTENKRKGTSIQIYFNPSNTLLKKGKLNIDNFKLFLSDIERSKEYITARNFQLNNNITDEKDEPIIIDQTLPILDQLYNYLSIRFKEITALPARFWAYSYPFKTSFKSYFVYSSFCLYTDNQELFNFFDSLTIQENDTIEFNDSNFINGVVSYEEKTQFILKTLNSNLAFSIICTITSTRKIIRFGRTKDCNCICCSFNKLKLSTVISQLHIATDDLEELSQQAYINYKLGFFTVSARLFLKVLERSEKKGLHLKSFIAKYNLSKLARFIRFRFSGEEVDEELNNTLEKIRRLLDFDFLQIKGDRAIAKWIKENRFFLESQYEIEQVHLKIKDYYFSQLYGGRGSNHFDSVIYNEYALLTSFLDRNYIIYDNFSEFSQLTEVYVESLFALYGVHKSMYSRLDNFDDWITSIFILNANPEVVNKYCNRYSVSSIEYNKTATLGSFIHVIRNFFTDKKALEVFKQYNLDDNFDFHQKYNRILSNILVIASFLKLEQKEVKEIAVLLKNYIGWQTQIKYHQTIKYITLFIEKKQSLFDLTILNEFFYLFFEYGFLHSEEYLSTLADAYNKNNGGLTYTTKLKQKIDQLLSNECPLCKHRHNKDWVISLHTIGKNASDKKYIKDKIIEALNSQFDWRLYYLAAMHDILGVDNNYFKELLSIRKPSGNKGPFSHYSSDEQNRDFRLGAIINLCFKYNIDTSNDDFFHLKGFDPYYDWLLDMGHFDYTHFNPRWVSEYGTLYYFNKMKTYPIIGEKILEYLNENNDPQLKDNFISIYGEQLALAK